MRRLRIPRCDYINGSTVWDLVTMRFSGSEVRPMGEPWVIDCLRLEVGCWLSFPYSQVVSCQRIETGP